MHRGFWHIRLTLATSISISLAVSASPILHGQTTARFGAKHTQAGEISSQIPDLSGTWRGAPVPGGIQSVSLANPDGTKRGKEDDIPYQPWALAKTMSEVPSGGPEADFGTATDPWFKYCEPLGPYRQYFEPGAHRFIQTPDTVYLVHEIGLNYQIVRLNGKHVEHPMPLWWGDSIGWYENGDTLVIDTIGIDDRTWLDKQGHPHTIQLHMVERYKRVDPNTLELDVTYDDPGAYTKPFKSHRTFLKSAAAFLKYQWSCSTRENEKFYDELAKPAIRTTGK
jgi:hypothetical protein